MKKDDFVTKDIEEDIIKLGYEGSFPVEVRPVSEWLNKKYHNSVLRHGHNLFREDLFQEACLKYPVYNSMSLLIVSHKDDYYGRRNYIIRLAIDEIKYKCVSTKTEA